MSSPKSEPNPLPDLEDVLALPFDDIVHRFLEDWDLSFEEAQDIFTETKKFLWLQCASYHDRKAGLTPPSIGFTPSTYLIDQMWHQFMLFTPNYHHFTYDTFGYFLGHAPVGYVEKLEMKAAMEADPEGERNKRELELKAQYDYVKEKLGPETVEKWYTTWAEKYTEERLNQLRKPIRLSDF